MEKINESMEKYLSFQTIAPILFSEIQNSEQNVWSSQCSQNVYHCERTPDFRAIPVFMDTVNEQGCSKDTVKF